MDPTTSALLTDLYQLTMLQAYFDNDVEDTAVFELFMRKLPESRNFMLAAGLEQALEFLEGLRFTQEERRWLRGTGRFTDAFVDYLGELRFTGEVHAMPEGTVFFPDEPVLRVVAPMPQAQLVESRLLNIIHFQTLIATKAARCRLAAPEALLVDFGMRRAHGAEAGLLAARASYLAGMDGSATVLAGAEYGLPLYGTMAHSFIEAHDDEVAAFEAFARAQPGNVVLLIDTYDTEAGAERVVELAPRLAEAGIAIKGVRLDSGDLGEHARRVRAILDRGGCSAITIFASSSIDEYKLRDLRRDGAPIDGYGIGTHLTTASDRPYLDCAYKLQEYAGVPRRKRSEGKATWPGRKQVLRHFDSDGCIERDVLTVEDDRAPGTALLQRVMTGGRRCGASEPLTALRERARAALDTLPAPLRGLEGAPPFEVEVSEPLRALAEAVDRSAG